MLFNEKDAPDARVVIAPF